ncbi:MAG: hypothetical protein AB1564_15935 [Chloroflexota bacterium]
MQNLLNNSVVLLVMFAVRCLVPILLTIGAGALLKRYLYKDRAEWM